jgi:hypothetical protein
MGAKVANPDKLCVNDWGDAAIGMTGVIDGLTARVEALVWHWVCIPVTHFLGSSTISRPAEERW